MSSTYLDFEQPIAEMEAKLAELRNVGSSHELDLDDEIQRLETRCREQMEQIFSDLTDWQISQLARHPERPHTLDYIPFLFDRFEELHGDRHFGDDHAIVGGPAALEGRAVMVIGHQKGRDTKQKIHRNFGMPRPEGYRKAQRLMEMAERFGLPIITLIDTPGAYPGVGAEERGQSEAIAKNLKVMSRLEVPILCTVIGEGGSGGALAIGVGDRTNMLQFSIYSVISPEGCASILYKSADKAETAAGALGLTARRLKQLGLIDQIVREPLGGAHRNTQEVAGRLKEHLLSQLKVLDGLTTEELIEARYRRLMGMAALERE
ncbi:MAG: acetyl-CoA carboxylase carboxyltransferase subunit alpha [Wenzhouxiangellaceae bacterium]|jgi:acetyl-CoA carboxylase carboxyl transferase subunit alpha|nr:acetyl-CoA carboxylase carboxyltransferase subunit alpha [Wenzhouxiangellaceae bacterium]MBS3746129.1 acetyl-CoA carboxylase carboxyltransferase subunit alpha [Wenzhouxiangellaceae bacterium]MBS3823998.1 acetyl-CoA carboxylase carboxyltransferase subunit alpha [Wenzhouxiangellaceae bacterium]